MHDQKLMWSVPTERLTNAVSTTINIRADWTKNAEFELFAAREALIDMI